MSNFAIHNLPEVEGDHLLPVKTTTNSQTLIVPEAENDKM
jgi:hypothetical protein